jgi:hypothetical protein
MIRDISMGLVVAVVLWYLPEIIHMTLRVL